MNALLNELIRALREELQQHGEMLARFDDRQEHLRRNPADAALASVTSLRQQGRVIQQARHQREEAQRELARRLGLPEAANLRQMVPFLLPSHQPLVRALMDENNDLALKVRQRGRHSDLLLRRSLCVMQGLLSATFPARRREAPHGESNSFTEELPAWGPQAAVG